MLIINNDRKNINKVIKKLNFFHTDVMMMKPNKAKNTLDSMITKLINETNMEKERLKCPRI